MISLISFSGFNVLLIFRFFHEILSKGYLNYVFII